MSPLSHRLQARVRRLYTEQWGLRPVFIDLGGRLLIGLDPFEAPRLRRRRAEVLQQSLSIGEATRLPLGGALEFWAVALEHRRLVHGGLAVGAVLVLPQADRIRSVSYRRFAWKRVG